MSDQTVNTAADSSPPAVIVADVGLLLEGT